MADDDSTPPEEERDTVLDAGLRAAYPKRAREQPSIIERIERVSGASSRVLLRDIPDEHSPVLKMHKKGDPEGAEDDTRYQVLGEIGRGGVGLIFKSRDRDLGRDVALKVLRSEHLEKDGVVDRFIEEAQVAGQLQHPGIVPVYGMGLQPDGRPFFVMKLVKGKTLSALLSERRNAQTDRQKYLAIFEQICQTMAYSHAKGVIHRDLKPANIMVGAFGELQIMDWGFAKVLGRDEPEQVALDDAESLIATVRTEAEGSQSIAGSIMGTPAYMPPEQAMGRVADVDERADVFAMGSILCQILTGEPAYVGEGSDRLIQAVRADIDDAMQRLDACDVDDDLRKLAKACLSPTRGDRPRNAGIVADAFSAYLAGIDERARAAELEVVNARAEAEQQREAAVRQRAKAEQEREREAQAQSRIAFERKRRRRTFALTGLVLAALLVGGGAFFFVAQERAEQERETEQRVYRALDEAGRLRSAGKYSEATAVVEAAMEAEWEDDELRREAGAVISAIMKEAGEARDRELRAQADAALLAELSEISEWVMTQSIYVPMGLDTDKTEERYARAFLDYGIDVADRDGQEPTTAQMMAGAQHVVPGSPFAVELAAALDDWIYLRRVALRQDRFQWNRLRNLANHLDPDRRRARLRAAAHGSDLVKLRALAEEAVRSGGEMPARTRAAIGRALTDAWDPKGALDFLRDAQRKHPGDLWIHHYVAHACVYSNPPLWEEAIRARMAIVALRPESAHAWSQLAYVYVASEQHADAIDAYARSLTLDSTSFVPHMQFGMAQVAVGDEARARAAYEAIELDEPNLPMFLMGVGIGLASKTKLIDANRVLKEAEGLDPSNPLLPGARAQLALASNDPEGAVAAAKRSVELDGGTGPSYMTLGRIQSQLGNIDAAIEAYRGAVKAQPGFMTYGFFIDMLEHTGRTDTWVEVLREAAAAHPNKYWFQSALARGLISQGKIEEGLTYLDRATELRPDEKVIRVEVVLKLMARLEDPSPAILKAARELATYATQLDEPHDAAWDAMAAVHIRAGELDAAEAALSKTPATETSRHASLRALLALERGDKAGARALLPKIYGFMRATRWDPFWLDITGELRARLQEGD